MKNGKLVGTLALGMFAWGAFKGLTIGRQLHDGCPLCAQRKLASPSHLLNALVVAPTVEEFQFREVLPKVAGGRAASVIFGVAHMNPKLGLAGNALRMTEAGLAGALVYAKAYKQSGLTGAAIVHGAHNLGSALGAFFSMEDRVKDEGWCRVEREVQPGVFLRGCVRNG